MSPYSWLRAAGAATVLVPISIARGMQTPRSAPAPTTVVYAAPAADAPPAVDAKPLIDLGASGAAEELFNRIVAVRRQSSGRIIVANSSPPELRVFDATGRFVRTIGRKGAGPGEYEDISDMIVRPRDSILVLDRRQRRFTFFGPDGGVGATLGFTPPFETSPFNVTINSFDDGSLLIGYGLFTASKPSPTPIAASEIVGRYAVTGTRLDSIGPFFTNEIFLQVAPPTSGGRAFWDRTFGRKGAIVATGNSFIAGDASAMEVRRYSPKGVLLEVHRIEMPRKTVTPADIERHKKAVMDASRPQSRDVDQKRVDEMPYPAQFPAYHKFLIDARGRIWLHQYLYPATENRWIVMDPKTRQSKAVRLPDRFIPYEIGAADIVGVWRDEDDVEHVRVYKLVN